MLLLLRQQSDGQTIAAMQSAELIAHSVIDGARNRAKDRHLRTVLDQQQRTESLHSLRRRRRRAPPTPRKPRRAPPPALLYEIPRGTAENLPRL